MRSLKFTLAAMAASVALGAASAEPVKIRSAWVAPVSNWASIVAEKKDLAKHLGQVLHVRSAPLRRHAADDDRDRRGRA